MKKMPKKKNVLLALILMMLASSSTILAFSGVNSTNAQTSTAVSNNLLQYEWPKVGADSANTHFSAGPAPDSPDVLWQRNITSAVAVHFNGMTFIAQGRNVLALDGLTGSIVYNVTIPPIVNRTSSAGVIFKIDNDRMGVQLYSSDNWPTAPAVWALRVCRISNGELLWADDNPKVSGSGLRGGGFNYIPEEKMAYVVTNYESGRAASAAGVGGALQAWDLSDPTNPTLEWTYNADGTLNDWCSWGVTYGEGKIWLDNNALHVTCLDARSGGIIWETELTGGQFYPGTYYQGMLLRGLLDNTFVAINASNGNVLWKNRPSSYGFWCSGASASYGMAYMPNVDGNIYAINVTTGQIVWKHWSGGLQYPGHVQIADGKVYTCTSQKAASPLTPETSHSEYSCLDAFTGEVIWKLYKEFGAGPFDYCSIAYGNLYAVDTGAFTGGISALLCFGPTKDWPMFLGNSEHTATGYGGPVNMTINWKFATKGQVISSPAVVNGKVFFGSADKNWYCINATTGQKIWNFTAGFRIRSSPAVVDNRMYTGADDGFVYCLNAETGQQLWKTATPGTILTVNTEYADEFRSSPNVANNNVYVGSLDGKLYCLKAGSGSIAWTIQTTGPIISTPTLVNNDGLYFATLDGFVYKVNADTGSIIWNQSTPIGRDISMMGTPVIGQGLVFIGSGGATVSVAKIGQFYALNATTGKIVWATNQLAGSGSLNPVWSMLYNNGKVYFADFFSLSCANATTGVKLWSCFLTREHLGSLAYADGKIYVPSDSFAVYVVDADSGAKLGFFGTDAQVRSSPAIYQNKLYVGSNDWNVYCIMESSVGTTLYAQSSPNTSQTPSPSTSPEPNATPSPSLSPSPTSVQTQTPTPTQSPSPSPTPTPTTNTSNTTLYIVIAAVIIIVIIAAAVLLLRRRK
jgi:eukaryotic-like serine/threonine-protein kinase